MPEPTKLLETLKQLNYFKYVPQPELDQAIQNAEKSLIHKQISFDSDLYQENKVQLSRDRRRLGVDSEELAEGGIAKTIKALSDMLRTENVPISSISQNIGSGDGYSIEINGKKYLIYTEDEIKSNNLWLLSLIGLIKVVNDLLSQANSDARLYATAAGNDGSVYLLTPEIFQFLKDNQINTADSIIKPLSYEEQLESAK